MSVLGTIRKRSSTQPLIRSMGSTVIDRVNTPNTPLTTTIDVHIQPLSDKELRNVPEGQNTLEWVNIWSVSEIKNKDVISIYTVQKVKYWAEGPFWKAQAVKVTD